MWSVRWGNVPDIPTKRTLPASLSSKSASSAPCSSRVCLDGRHGTHDIEIIGVHPRKTLLDTRPDVVPRKDVRPSLPARCDLRYLCLSVRNRGATGKRFVAEG